MTKTERTKVFETACNAVAHYMNHNAACFGTRDKTVYSLAAEIAANESMPEKTKNKAMSMMAMLLVLVSQLPKIGYPSRYNYSKLSYMERIADIKAYLKFCDDPLSSEADRRDTDRTVRLAAERIVDELSELLKPYSD